MNFADRVKETTVVVGTGDAALLGAPLGYQTFLSTIGVSVYTFYCINNLQTGEWEVGRGMILTGPTRLVRTAVISSSNSNSIVNFAVGVKEVFITYPASKAVTLDASTRNLSVDSISVSGSIHTPNCPIWWGATGDGIRDDTVEVQNAANYGKSLYLPPEYKFLISGVNIQNHRYWTDNTYTVRNPKFGFRVYGGGWLVQKQLSSQSLMYVYNVDGFEMRGVTLYGNKSIQSSSNYGLYAVDSSFGKITDCVIDSFKGSNVVIAASADVADEWNFTGNEIIFSGGYGVFVQNCGDHCFVSNHINFHAWDGIGFSGAYTCTLTSNDILTNTFSGCNIMGSRNIVLTGNMIRENSRHGLIMSGGLGGHSISNNYFMWNSQAGQGLYDGVNMTYCPSIRLAANDSSDYYNSPYSPVNGISRQRYGVYAENCVGIMTDGSNKLYPNYTGTIFMTGSSSFAVGV